MESTNNENVLSLNEVTYGKVHNFQKTISASGDEQYHYKGRLHSGEIRFYYNNNLINQVPVAGSGDYGFTLEGEAKELFTYNDAFVTENKSENKLFIYINNNTKLSFNGSYLNEYNFFFEVLKENNNPNIVRWISIYAEKVI